MDVVTNAWFQTAVVGGALIFGLTRYLRPKTAYKTDWVKDVVYLYQFPRLKFIPSISPFALKVETWLRLKKITYESIEGTKWSRGGKQVPFIELNGEEVFDSNVIIPYLREKFQKEDDMDDKDRGASLALMRMMDEHFVHSYFWYRYVDHWRDEFFPLWTFPIPGFARILLTQFQPRMIKKKGWVIGHGRLPTDTIYKFGMDDVKAMNLGRAQSSFMQCIFDHLHRSRQDGSLCDLTLLVDGKDFGKETEKIHVHKVILTAASPFLKELYLEGKLQGDVFVVRGVDVDNVRVIINWVYGQGLYVTPENRDGLYDAAKALGIESKIPSEDEISKNGSFVDDSEWTNSAEAEIKEEIPTEETEFEANLSLIGEPHETSGLVELNGDFPSLPTEDDDDDDGDVELTKKATLMGITTWNSDELLFHSRSDDEGDEAQDGEVGKGKTDGGAMDEEEKRTEDSGLKKDQNQVAGVSQGVEPEADRKRSTRRRRPVIRDDFDCSQPKKRRRKVRDAVKTSADTVKRTSKTDTEARTQEPLVSDVTENGDFPESATLEEKTDRHEEIGNDKESFTALSGHEPKQLQIVIAESGDNSLNEATGLPGEDLGTCDTSSASSLAHSTAANALSPFTTSASVVDSTQNETTTVLPTPVITITTTIATPASAPTTITNLTTTTAAAIPTTTISTTTISTTTISTASTTVPTNTSKLQCDECGKGFGTAAGLRSHRKIYHKEGPRRKFLCDECGREFLTQPGVYQHKRSAHPAFHHLFNCEHCEFVTAQKSSLQCHMFSSHKVLHPDSKRYECVHCPYQSVIKCHLDKHVLRCHQQTAADRKQACRYCDKKFLFSSELNGHIRKVHLRVRKFPCEDCDQSFISKSHLGRHVASVHKKGAKVICGHCGFTTTRKDNLKTHHKFRHPTEVFSFRVVDEGDEIQSGSTADAAVVPPLTVSQPALLLEAAE